MSDAAGGSPVFRPAGISYVRIPGADPHRLAAFYASVFAWKVDLDRADPSFEDGTGHVIGHFVSDQSVAGEGGVVHTSSSSASTTPWHRSQPKVEPS